MNRLQIVALVFAAAGIAGGCGPKAAQRPAGDADATAADTASRPETATAADTVPRPDASGGVCSERSDCETGVCRKGRCIAASCTDGMRNGEETDVDCGGPNCPSCEAGDGCERPGDCIGGVCRNLTCREPSCSDGVQNGGETDVDCGGDGCPACKSGRSCETGADCVSAICQNKTCQKPTCSDQKQNGEETDVDCGGTTCRGCPLGRFCEKDRDCRSGRCGTNHTCERARRFEFSQGYRISDSCSNGASTGGGCAMRLDCRGSDVIWNWQARHTSGDSDQGTDDFHTHAPASRCLGTMAAPSMDPGALTVHASSCEADADTYRAWAYCVPRGPGFDFGAGYRTSASCSATSGTCTMNPKCNGKDIAWLAQARRTDGDSDESHDDFHDDTAASKASPSLAAGEMTLRPSSPGGDVDDYRAWMLCLPRGGGFDWAGAYTVHASCTASQGDCALRAKCNNDDRLFNYQARHTAGDDDSSSDDLHGDFSLNSPPPSFSGSSITLHPSSPGGDHDTYEIWGLCIPMK